MEGEGRGSRKDGREGGGQEKTVEVRCWGAGGLWELMWKARTGEGIRRTEEEEKDKRRAEVPGC